MTVQLFDIWFYMKRNSKQQYKTHQSLSPRKWEGQDGGWAQSAPNTGCAREQASVLLRKSLFGGNPSEGFTDIRRWPHFTDSLAAEFTFPGVAAAQPHPASSCLLGPTGPYWALCLRSVGPYWASLELKPFLHSAHVSRTMRFFFSYLNMQGYPEPVKM